MWRCPVRSGLAARADLWSSPFEWCIRSACDPSCWLCGEGSVVGLGDLLGVWCGFTDAAGAGEGVEAEVAALLGPLIVLLGEDGSDEADDAVAVREDADDIGAAANLPVQPLGGVVGPDLLPDCLDDASESACVKFGKRACKHRVARVAAQ